MAEPNAPAEPPKAHSPQEVIKMIQETVLQRNPKLSGNELQKEIYKEAQRLYEKAKNKKASATKPDNQIDATTVTMTPAGPTNSSDMAKSASGSVAQQPQASATMMSSMPVATVPSHPSSPMMASTRTSTRFSSGMGVPPVKTGPRPSDLLRTFFSAPSTDVTEQAEPHPEKHSLSPQSYSQDVASPVSYSHDVPAEKLKSPSRPPSHDVPQPSTDQASRKTSVGLPPHLLPRKTVHEAQMPHQRPQRRSEYQFTSSYPHRPVENANEYRTSRQNKNINEYQAEQRRDSSSLGQQRPYEQFSRRSAAAPPYPQASSGKVIQNYTDQMARELNAAATPSVRTVGTNTSSRRFEAAPPLFDGGAIEEHTAAADEHVTWPKGRVTWTGEAAELVNKFKCHFPNCPNSYAANGFKTIGQLNTHKNFMHDICKKCDIEFEDSQALLIHKQTSPNHIACWTCGLDFQTATARERHMLNNHPSLRDLRCPGCGIVHGSGSSFVRHLEKDGCDAIDAEQFEKARLMLTKVIPDAKMEEERLRKYEAGTMASPSLLDLDDAEEFPSLMGRGPRPQPSREASTGRPSATNAPREGDSSEARVQGGLVGKLEQLAKLGPHPNKAIDPDQRRLLEIFQRMIGPDHGIYEPPLRPDGEIIHEAIPGDPLYNPAVFRNPFGSYNCPHPFCTKAWKSERALDSHLKGDVHSRRNYRCPECMAYFHSANAITAHMESPSVKCNIRHTAIFREAMEIASGSFLTATMDGFGKLKIDTQEPKW